MLWYRFRAVKPSQDLPQIDELLHTWNWLIVDKPAGMVVTEREHLRTNEQDFSSVDVVLKMKYPYYTLRNVHQIDARTSGVYCIALNKRAASDAGKMFRERLVKKCYVAMVDGWVDYNQLSARYNDGSNQEHVTLR